jgi:uncharacterized protein YndB with AHSA1/START domain
LDGYVRPKGTPENGRHPDMVPLNTAVVEKEFNMGMNHGPLAKAEMLIRKPVAEVFEAFVNPALTSRFWFTKGSGRLETGRQITWEWEMYDVSVQVDAKAVEENARILIEWPGQGAPTMVEWVFTSRPDHTTFVSITNRGFSGDPERIVQQAIDSTEGFTLVLAGAKAFLEYNVMLNLVADRFPDGVGKH